MSELVQILEKTVSGGNFYLFIFFGTIFLVPTDQTAALEFLKQAATNNFVSSCSLEFGMNIFSQSF
jgi:hypothetical protein